MSEDVDKGNNKGNGNDDDQSQGEPQIPKCKHCGATLTSGENWYPSMEKKDRRECKACCNKQRRENYRRRAQKGGNGRSEGNGDGEGGEPTSRSQMSQDDDAAMEPVLDLLEQIATENAAQTEAIAVMANNVGVLAEGVGALTQMIGAGGQFLSEVMTPAVDREGRTVSVLEDIHELAIRTRDLAQITYGALQLQSKAMGIPIGGKQGAGSGSEESLGEGEDEDEDEQFDDDDVPGVSPAPPASPSEQLSEDDAEADMQDVAAMFRRKAQERKARQEAEAGANTDASTGIADAGEEVPGGGEVDEGDEDLTALYEQQAGASIEE